MNRQPNAQTLDSLPRPEDRPRRHVYENVADLIADPENPTPMVRLSARSRPSPEFDIYVKLERNNPFGSIKDRTALFLMRGTPLTEGQVLTEPTAGNTGIALAALANAQGTPIELALPDGTPEEKKALLRFLGAELLEVEDELCPLFPTEGARGVVKSLVESAAFNGRYVSPNQYENQLNVEAHYRTTGPEIWNQTEGRIDYFFAAWPLPEGTQSGRQDHRHRAGIQAAQAVRHQENQQPAGGTPAQNPGLFADRRHHRGRGPRGLRGRHPAGPHRGPHGRAHDRRLPARSATGGRGGQRGRRGDFARRCDQVRQRLRRVPETGMTAGCF
jgi:hypothetical protein